MVRNNRLMVGNAAAFLILDGKQRSLDRLRYLWNVVFLFFANPRACHWGIDATLKRITIQWKVCLLSLSFWRRSHLLNSCSESLITLAAPGFSFDRWLAVGRIWSLMELQQGICVYLFLHTKWPTQFYTFQWLVNSHLTSCFDSIFVRIWCEHEWYVVCNMPQFVGRFELNISGLIRIADLLHLYLDSR